ncbi:hypothetical protein D3C87_2128260 [compost metagenome]
MNIVTGFLQGHRHVANVGVGFLNLDIAFSAVLRGEKQMIVVICPGNGNSSLGCRIRFL